MKEDNEYKGTTTIGIICREGVVLATEKRATMGHFIASQNAKKVYQIDDLIAMTLAGSVGDAQKIIKWIQMEANLYKMQRGESMTIKGMTNVIANILSNSRQFPFSVQLLIGGFDKNGPSIYSLDAIGGIIEEKNIVSTGSGSPMAYGVLEDRYVDNMPIDEGVNLAIRALHNAMKRDSASGGEMDVVKITSDSYIQLENAEVRKIREMI